MDKTITIDGRQVTFRKTGGTMLRYKRQFGRELYADLDKIYAALPMLEAIKTDKEAAIHAMLGTETEWMYDIAYIMAQQADASITDELSWLDSFEDFNIWNVFMSLFDLLKAEQTASPKNV